MQEATTTLLLALEKSAPGSVVAFDLGIKTLAVGTNEQERIYHVGGFKGS
jgi:transposase